MLILELVLHGCFSAFANIVAYYATKCNFQPIFSKLYFYLHIWLLSVAGMVAYATTVFLQIFSGT